METILPEFSKQLKCWRKSRKRKQEEVAEYLHCPLRQLQRTEYGGVNLLTLTLVAIADYFGVTTDCLLGRGACGNARESMR